MKVKIVFCLLFAVSMSFAQFTREEKLQQLKSRQDIKVTEVEKDLLKLEYPNGKVFYKNIREYKYPESGVQHSEYSPTFDSTIIDLTAIDTMLYNHKYRFWQTVLISNRKFPIIGDINGNGRVELYGFEKDYTTDYTSVVAKEMNVNGTFDSVWYYNPSTLARNIYDIDSDGSLDLHLTSDESDTVIHWAIQKSKIFTKPNDTSLAINLSFEFQAEDSNTVQYNPRFAMLDGDSRTDYIYLGAPTRKYLGIYEYNPVTNSLDSVLHYNYAGIDDWVEGFAVDDFDNDNIPEIIIGGIYGKVASFESTGDNAYQLIWTGEVLTNNAYMLGSTDDIDRNGKKELWVGGEAFYNGVPIIKFSCFESNGNNSYEIVGRIDLVGVFTFYAYNIQAVDVDNDGIDELMICIDGNFLILKFNGSPEHQTYEVYYIKKVSGEYIAYWGATMYDLDYDGNKEILIDMHDDPPQLGNIKFFTSIYTPDSLSSINESSATIIDYRLEQNFPNPFNSSTQIKFVIPNTSLVTIKVYNLLGKEITELINEELPYGNYTINWEARDRNNNSLPSGIYFIKLNAGSFNKTIKAVLLK
ncbi:T9SS type A sorting domain-containing protein [Ignavibacterium sp.]|uniref:T9SS type A sorting domain-containing protein n=2 Tax=Ignavibacterium sp. TaxID=2651167 RepID=UPI00307F4946